MEWYTWYWSKYEGDTLHLNLEQDAIYRRIIDWYISRQTPPPDNDQALASICRISVDKWHEHAEVIRGLCKSVDGKIRLKLCDMTISEQKNRSDSRLKNAQSAAQAKWVIKDDLSVINRRKRSQRLASARKQKTHSKSEWSALVDICGGMCCRCGSHGVIRDHIVPIYQGGHDGIENLQPLCRKCNSSKGPDTSDLRPSGWKERLRNACETPANACYKQTDQQTNKQINNKDLQTNQEGFRSFHASMNGEGFGGSQTSGFEPDLETAEKLRSIAYGWDQHALIEKYNAWQDSQSDRPRNPQAAFLGWAKNFTKGRKPS